MGRERKSGTFVSTRPCNRGHVGERYVAGHTCVVCAKMRAAQRYEAKREAIVAQVTERYRQDPETHKKRVALRRRKHPQKVRAEKRAEYERHRDEYIARARRNDLARPELRRAWRAKHRRQLNHIAALHQALRRKRAPPWLTAEHKRAMRGFYDEARRLTVSTGIPHEVDHIVPLVGAVVSGLHVPWNLQILTRATNRSKKNKLVAAPPLS